MIKDTSYALVRRLFFVETAIREYIKRQGKSSIVIADIGCGTGELLTIPLAELFENEMAIDAYEPDWITFQRLRTG
jgi:2-polyprenyl-3-methyl-5-hydroxy-6-metoxy-1,4-benzoquinol methylase